MDYLVTGGSGLLGKELQKQGFIARYPSHEELEITNFSKLYSYFTIEKLFGFLPKTIIHCAAVTSPPKIDKAPMLALDTNIIGTANIVNICNTFGIKLIYISTDYVFSGHGGGYTTDEPVNPVNKYGISKLGGECAVRMMNDEPGWVIIRTSFGENEFPHKKAIVDQYTSRVPVSTFARQLMDFIKKDEQYSYKLKGIFHIAGERKSVYEYASRISPKKKIGKIWSSDLPFEVPRDTSLDCSKYLSLFKGDVNV